MRALFTFVIALSSLTLFAGVGLRFEAGPVLNLENGAEIANLLMNRQLEKCIADFHKEDGRVTEVTRQSLDPQNTVYQLKGIVLQNGHIVVGSIVMTITKTKHLSLGFETNETYECEVAVDKNK